MGFHWKAQLFVALVSSFPPLLLLNTFSRASYLWNATLAAFSIFFFLNYTYPFFTSPLRDIPGPPAPPKFIFGYGMEMLRRPPASNWVVWSRVVPNNGLIQFRSWFHYKQFLLCMSPEAIREILLDKPYDYAKPERAAIFLSRILGDGLVIVEGQEHKLQRKIVAPAFQGQHIHGLIPLFWSKAQELAETLATELTAPVIVDGKRTGVVEITSIASRASLDIIGVAGLGRDFRTLQNSDDELARSYHEITDPKGVNYFVANMLLPPWLVAWIPWKEHTRFNTITSALRRTAFNLLNEKRTSLASASTIDAKEGQRSDDILAILLKAKTPLTDDKLIDHLLTFLAAGHDTTSTAISWTMYLLAKHPEIQTQLRGVVRQTLLDDINQQESVDHKDKIRALDSLPLLQAVTNESLRLFPTVPTTARRVIRPTTLMGYPLALGTDVLISPFMMNRLPSLWGADADEFKPSRWIEGLSASTGGATSPYAFLTFLHGPRSCIGQGFARTELRYLLAALVLKFSWEMEDKDEVPVPAGAITIKPRDGLRVRLTEL